jgi:hypothetical protein
MDAYHDFGTDLVAGANGDLLSATGDQETSQRVIRRLYTPQGGYLWNLVYGAGLPQRVGETLTPDQYNGIVADILAACAQEPAIAQVPAPVVTLTPINNGLSGSIAYTDAATKTPQVIYFPAGN